jgi:2-amino-4-hydroxy-6-hydroxymethyldihydropteridine diphosphokinase
MKKTYLSLGTNLGDKKLNLDLACEKITLKVGSISRYSSIYETDPWGFSNQPVFYNQVIEVITQLSPGLLMKELHEIEKSMGRIREGKWTRRIIDLDIIYYEDQVISEDQLIIPHPYLQERKFVLVPLVEINPLFIHPIFNISNAELLMNCKDLLEVRKI